jgi:hypothetical protein
MAGWLPADAEFLRDDSQAGIGGPELVTFHDSRGQKMNIDPPGAAAMQLPAAYKGHDFGMGHFTGLVNFLVAGEEFRAAPNIPDQKLAIDQFMADDFAAEE